MLNEANLKAIEAAGAYYIVGAKLKQLPKAQQAQVLDKSAYTNPKKFYNKFAHFLVQSDRILSLSMLN